MSVSSQLPAPAPLTRAPGGAIWPNVSLSAPCQQQLDELLALAMNSGLLRSTYQHRDQKGSAILFHHIYDVMMERGRVQAAIVQDQVFWWCSRRSRSCMKKKYVLLTRVQHSLEAKVLDAACGRRAPNAAVLGDLIRHYTGVKSIPCAPRKVDASGPCVFSMLLEWEHRSDFA